MRMTWHPEDAPDVVSISVFGWIRIALRGTVLGVFVFGSLGLLLLVRGLERPLFGLHRPVTPYITQFVCRTAFRTLGMGFSTRGSVLSHKDADVSNHASWSVIFGLTAGKRICFCPL